MPNTFCTIITSDYFPKAFALYSSIVQFDPSISLHVLVADNKPVAATVPVPITINITIAADLSGYPLVTELYNKYALTDIDSFRWSLKPVWISYLLEKGFDKVLYLDCDMFFFNDYQFLFAELDQSAVLLTPNWINSDPMVNKESFFSLFTSGFFSAGFIGANKKGLPALQWWAHACHFMMGEHIAHGIRADQKYLDIFPIKFEETAIIRHRGCNIGAWNYDESRRELVNGEVLINGKYPVIFIHFDNQIVQEIVRGHDKNLLPYLQKYQQIFEESGFHLSDFIKTIDTHADAALIRKLKWNLRLKSRIKRMLYHLSQKL
jgi:hypothetical protein